MTVRLPDMISGLHTHQTGESVLDSELRAEQASSLGYAGRQVELSLHALRLSEECSVDQESAFQRATDAVYGYFIQRELCGFSDHKDAIAHYRIPKRVLVRLGAK